MTLKYTQKWLLHPADYDRSGRPTYNNFVNSSNILISNFNNNYVLFEFDDAIIKLMARINLMWHLDSKHSGHNNNDLCCFITVIQSSLT